MKIANLKEDTQWISFILYTEKRKTIATEKRSVVTRDWECEEAMTIKQQEGDFWG